MQRKREGRKPKSRRKLVRLIPVYRTTWTLYCQECKSFFQTTRRDAQTCSNRCRSRRFRRVQKERAYLRKMQDTEQLFDTPLYADGIEFATPSGGAGTAFLNRP